VGWIKRVDRVRPIPFPTQISLEKMGVPGQVTNIGLLGEGVCSRRPKSDNRNPFGTYIPTPTNKRPPTNEHRSLAIRRPIVCIQGQNLTRQK
jgi:hypothetical protein